MPPRSPTLGHPIKADDAAFGAATMLAEIGDMAEAMSHRVEAGRSK